MDSFVVKRYPAATKEKVSIAAAKMCAIDMRPFTSIEGQGTEQFVDTIIQVVSMKEMIATKELLSCGDTIKNHTEKTAANIRIKLRSIPSTVPYLNCTTDHCHQFDTNQDFMTITIHYCDPKSLKLINRVIGTFGVVDKTSESIQKYFSKEMDEFDIGHKIRTIVSDNATSMKLAFKNYGWVGCKAHDMALVKKWAFNQQTPKTEPDHYSIHNSII